MTKYTVKIAHGIISTITSDIERNNKNKNRKNIFLNCTHGIIILIKQWKHSCECNCVNLFYVSLKQNKTELFPEVCFRRYI